MSQRFFAPGLIAAIVSLYAAACSQPHPPEKPFEAYELPASPNYDSHESWAALPDRKDMADSVPAGVSPENQANALVDVFFIHPTTLLRDTSWNGALEDSALNLSTDKLPILNQATVFNESCKIYAPRYRQMTLGGFYGEEGTYDQLSMAKAIEVAYSDVSEAFEYYLENWNQGRPFIIASHSQGTVHAIRLLRERLDGTSLQNQLVAAYIPGWPFPADTFQTIPVCASPDQTGCVMGWAAWLEGKVDPSFDTFYKNAVVVNPISWRTDGLATPKEMHKGFVGRKFAEEPSAQKLSAQAYRGVLWVSKPFPLVPRPNFHIGDYNLFWTDIRENVRLRVDTYLAQHQPMR